MALNNSARSFKSPKASLNKYIIAGFMCAVCELYSYQTLLSPATCAWWASPASHSHSQRYLQIPADKTIICSASPWFRASGCVWCLPLASWLEKDGRFQIPEAPFVDLFYPITQPYAQTGLFYFFYFAVFCSKVCSNLGTRCLQSAKLCINTHVLLARCKRPLQCATEGTCGKMFKLDTYTGEPEQVEQKRTLQDEVIVLVKLRWQNTNTFRSIVNQRKSFKIPRGSKLGWNVSKSSLWNSSLWLITLICPVDLED